MKPEYSNLFTITSTQQNTHIILSFFYEWMETYNGKTAEPQKEKTASVALSISDAAHLVSELGRVLNVLEGHNNETSKHE